MKRKGLIAGLLAVLSTVAAAQERPRGQVVWTKDLNAARALSQKEYRPLLLFLFGDLNQAGDLRKHQREVDDLFGRPGVRSLAPEFVTVRVSCHACPQEANRFGISRGPLAVVLHPEGNELGRLSSTDDGILSHFLGRFADAFRPRPVEWTPSIAAGLDEARTRRGLLLVAACEGDCKVCERAEGMLEDRRLSLLRPRLSLVRLDKADHAEEIKRLGVAALPHLVLLRPGKDAGESPATVYKKSWPGHAKTLAQVIEAELKALDRP